MISKRVSELLKSRAAYPLARGYGAEVAKVINLASNESPLGPSPLVLRAIKREARHAGKYPDPSARELKSTIGDYLGVNASWIVLGNGSDELLDLICKAFLDEGDRALIPTPTFAMYELACRTNGGVPKFVRLQNFEWRVSKLKRELADAKLAFVGRPNNPTGNGISEGGLEELLATGKLIVIDEAYGEFAGYSAVGLLRKRKNLIVLRTFSKAFGLAGLRVGYAVGNPKLVEVLERIRAPFNVNRLAQAAAIAALRDKRYLRKVVTMIKRGRTYLRRELLKLELRVLPSDANFLMADVSPWGIDASAFCDFLAKQRILVRDLSNFRDAGSNYIRITVGTPQQNNRLMLALKKFKRRG
jgi:histidinol-phosphate aminotransferase